MGERAMRPFWIHQIAEYLIGIALVSQGLQDPEPLVPCVAGGLIALNAAVVRGPVGAFRWTSRRTHRWLDLALMVLLAAAAAQPWVELSSSSRLILLVIIVPIAFLWFYTDWAERPARRQRRLDTSGVTGEQIGRTAGRLAGVGYTAAKRAIKKSSSPARSDPS